MAGTGQPATTFKLDDAVATPSSEWAEATRAALEDKTTPVGTGASHTAAAPSGTAPVLPNSSTLPAGASISTTSPTAAGPDRSLFAAQPPTPGPHIPGAYPSPHETIPESTLDTSAISQDVNHMIQEAREHLPAQEDLEKAAQDMAKAATSLAQTATSYLPQSIASKVAELLRAFLVFLTAATADPLDQLLLRPPRTTQFTRSRYPRKKFSARYQERRSAELVLFLVA